LHTWNKSATKVSSFSRLTAFVAAQKLLAAAKDNYVTHFSRNYFSKFNQIYFKN
jgi:hypothetical protein